MKTLNLTDNQTGKKLIVLFVTILIVLGATYELSTRNTYFIQASEGDKDVSISHDEGSAKEKPVEKSEGEERADNEIGSTKEVANAKERTPKIPKAISAFTSSYRGSRIDKEYLGLLWESCGYDEKLLKTVVGIALAEGALGRDLPHRQSNWFGWFANNDRNFDPDRKTMSQVICKGIGKSYRAFGTRDTTAIYVRGKLWNDLTEAQQLGVQGEMDRFNWALYKMSN